MKYTLYNLPTVLLFILLAGCVDEEILSSPQEEERTVEIIFNTSAYTKTTTADPPQSDEDNITTIDLWGFAHRNDGVIINFVQKQTSTDKIKVLSNFFELNPRGERVVYTTLYAIANADRVNPVNFGDGTYTTLSQYTQAMNQIQSNYLYNRQPPISHTQEMMLQEIKTQNTVSADVNIDMNTPLMMSTRTVTGGASMVVMPLERIYCRIWFTFIITGKINDRVTINSIHLAKLNTFSYVFEERYLSPARNEDTWNAPVAGETVFKNDKGTQYVAQPLFPGNTFILCKTASSPQPYYFYSYQSIGENEDFDPVITLQITNHQGTTRTLTAPLYDSGSTDGKRYHGLLRNHSYQVISTISAGTLKLEGITVRSHDWFDRGEVDFPTFE